MRKHKGYSFINIVGLAIGIAACLLLFLWVKDELSYDRYHEKIDRIYRVVSQYEVDGNINCFAMTPAPLGPALVNEFPEVKKAVRFGKNTILVNYKNRCFYEKVFFADPEVFDVFTFPLIKGNPKTALKEPYSIVISEEIRDKYFGEDDPTERIIILGEKRAYKITGVFKNIPQNSHFRFHILGSFLDYASSHFDQWGISNYFTYILTAKDFSHNSFREKLPQFVEKHKGKESRYVSKNTFLLQPLSRIHLHSNLRGEIEPNSDIGTIYIFSVIALFILLIACLNYINLSTARYANRAKEVSLRKVIGAKRSQLIKQFLGESFLFSFIALPLAIALAELFLPLFNSLSGKKLGFNYFDNLFLMLGLFGIILCVGFASGIFPAFYISALQPIKVLKGMLKASSKVSWLRRSLVISQFTISIIFIISTIIIFNQLNYIREKKLGFYKEHIVNIPIFSKEVLQKYELVKSEFLQNTNVLAVSASSFFPGKNIWYQNYWREGAKADENLIINWISVDHNFIETFQLELLEGRNFSKDFVSDVERAYILNESAVKEMGWESPIDKKFGIIKRGTVIGVVKDFHFKPLHQEIKPVAICIYPEFFTYISVRISPENISHILDFLKKKWQKLIPSQSFEYSFLDDDFDNLYRTEMRLGKIFGIIASLAIFIACLGLFGLVAFTAEQRTKEIGIRKVLGASVYGIVILLSKEFVKWVLIANIIAWPVAYYAMNKWLQDFAYRINMGVWIFILAGALALILALLTVSYQAVKAALSNPVEALRYE